MPAYDGSLNVEKLIEWINTLDKYFNYEEVDEAKKVNFVVTKLREHAYVWWDGVQVGRQSKGKKNIKSWRKMVAMLKGEFLPKDY